MKKFMFFPAFALLLAMLFLHACDSADQPVPKEVPRAVQEQGVPTEIDPDGGIGFRDTCDQSSGQCQVTVTVTAGTASFDICGMLSGSGSCFLSTSCGEVGGDEDSYSSSPATFCISAEKLFYVRNTGTANITVTADAGASSSGPITISPNEVAVFEVESNCDITWLCTD